MKVFLEKEQRHVEVKPATISRILEELGIIPNTVIVSRNGNLVLPDTEVSENDDIIIYSVVSGG